MSIPLKPASPREADIESQESRCKSHFFSKLEFITILLASEFHYRVPLPVFFNLT